MKKIVVIGGVAAGLKAAAKARRCDPKAHITVVEKGELISYGACGMPYYVAGDVDNIEQLMMTPAGAVRNPAFFKNVKDIEVKTKTLATKINRDRKTVTVKNLESGEETELPYDKLVIATGASPVKPPLPGIELANIFQMWHPNDAKAVREGLERGKFSRAVIIGAGLVGMEMAEALKMWEVDVAVVEMKEQVFPAFLDPEIAGAVEKYAQEKGIHIYTGEKVERFSGDGSVQEVVTDKRVLPADLVILAIGVRPNVELARDAGLELGVTGAIAVNEYMQTSDPDIYAGGDCVENTNIITGRKVYAPMGSTANKHGRVIGENLCGAKAKFRGVLNTVVVKVMDLNVGKVGLTERDAKELGYEYVTALIGGHDRPHYMPGAKLMSLKIIVDANTRRVLGAQAFGEAEIAKRIDVIATAITLGGTVDDLFDIDLGYAPPYSSPIDNVAVAANAVMNKLAGKLKGISPLEAKDKLNCEDIIFLDVRSPEECKQIRLANCKDIRYIPLGQLRKRLSELDKDKEIIAFCKISLRGYEAALILEGEGFDKVKVMEGGIIAWPFACEK
ncbi:FAD-dependent oxidoreductase [Sporolituus thermophilus]|uniref:NADPH-dependent 2,4-dienoyl-CoA reductase, sulfur reductase n=1 Tax=Sporolituus thermophilus DSM 23256 TaxID=1123285 RepID=A0A1G7N885_9FIRM|nr:FAD-dependent oxidoreductase [Sporolituus thermophilus]SDF70288.1 NADPH-dependent 2,4-dienoyl-CoA reductase, sulfur reductase [Sporolituus thermophilus DSM 23256]